MFRDDIGTYEVVGCSAAAGGRWEEEGCCEAGGGWGSGRRWAVKGLDSQALWWAPKV